MALQTSGQISINDLKTEFGSTSNCLADYYAGGGIVNAATAPNVPTSGQICLSDFYGASASSPTFPASYSWRPYDGTISYSSQNLIVEGEATVYATEDATSANTTTAALSVQYVKFVRTSSGYQVQFYGPSGLTTYTSYDTNDQPHTESRNTWHVGASGSVSPTSVKWNATLEADQISGNPFDEHTQVQSTNVAPAGATATYAPSSNAFQSLSSGQSIGLIITTDAQVLSGQTGSYSSNWDLEFTLRRSGYDDTSLNFLISSLATATNTKSSSGGGFGGGGGFANF